MAPKRKQELDFNTRYSPLHSGIAKAARRISPKGRPLCEYDHHSDILFFLAYRAICLDKFAIRWVFPLSWSHYVRSLTVQNIRDPFVLEFLGLKDEYSESELEAALICRMEKLLLEVDGDFTFVGRIEMAAHWRPVVSRGFAALPPAFAVPGSDRFEAGPPQPRRRGTSNLSNKVLAREHKLCLPDEKVLIQEIADKRIALLSPAKKV